MVINQCLMNTERSNEHVEECTTHQASHRVRVTKIKRITIVRECTHEVWMKSMVKDYVILEEVQTPHYENI